MISAQIGSAVEGVGGATTPDVQTTGVVSGEVSGRRFCGRWKGRLCHEDEDHHNTNMTPFGHLH